MKDWDFPWLALFLVVAYGSVRLSKRYFGTWFSPVSMYVGMNALSMAGYHMKWLAYHDISVATHVLLLLSMAAFVVGTQTALGRTHRAESLPVSLERDPANIDRFFYLTVVLASAGWMLASFILVSRLGFGVLIRNIWMLQSEFQMQYIGYLNVLGILVLPIHTIRALMGRTRPLDLLLVASALLGLLLSGIKSYLITSIVSSMIIWAAMRPTRFRPAYLISGLGILLAFFIAYSANIDIFVANSFAGNELSQKYSMFQRPYLYFTGSWPALESIVKGVQPDLPYMGYITWQPLWKFLSLFGVFDVQPRYLPFSLTGASPFNVYAFAGEVYWDWGWIGVAVYSWALGFFTSALYLRARRCAYWGHLLTYGVLGYGVFMSVFAYFIHFKMMLELAYVYLVGFVLMRSGILVDKRRHV